MGIQDGLQAPTVRSAGNALQAGIEPAGSSRERQAGDRQDQDDGDQADDQGAEIREGERVEVDPRVLRWPVESSRRPLTEAVPADPVLSSSVDGSRGSSSRRADANRPRSQDGGFRPIMAKRARGTTTRPGQRRPMQRQAARPSPATTAPGGAAASRPASLTAEEEARAAELEAAIVAEARQADESRRQARMLRDPIEGTVGSSAALATAAANEYAYVARDVRRIALVGGTLISLLIAVWLIVQLTGTAR